MRPSNFLTYLTVFAAVSSALEWPSNWNPLALAEHEVAPLLRRQNNNKQQSSSQAGTTSKGNGKNTQSSTVAKQTGKNTITASASSSAPPNTKDNGKKTTTTGKGGNTSDNKKTTAKYETTKSFDPRLPAGGISMVTPNIMSGAQYYKIQDYVTFAWNFTSLSVTPTALDIMASCTTNSALYTIALNQSVSGATQAVTWDTGKYQSSATIPLLVATYTLIIYDADSSVSATPRAGYLAVFDQFTFGMYTPQPYTPIADFQCATCNGASAMERQTWKFLLGMVAVTVLSFGWFAGVAGLW
jgi:hypothetical protein